MLGSKSKSSLITGFLVVARLASAQLAGPYQFGAGCSLTLQGVQNNDKIAIVPAANVASGATVHLSFNAVFSDSGAAGSCANAGVNTLAGATGFAASLTQFAVGVNGVLSLGIPSVCTITAGTAPAGAVYQYGVVCNAGTLLTPAITGQQLILDLNLGATTTLVALQLTAATAPITETVYSTILSGTSIGTFTSVTSTTTTAPFTTSLVITIDDPTITVPDPAEGTVTVYSTTTITTLAGTETINLVYVTPLFTSTVLATSTPPCMGGVMKRQNQHHLPNGAPRATSVRDVGAFSTTISTVVLYSNPPQTISTTTTAVLTRSSIIIDQTTTTAAAVTVTAGPSTVTVVTSTVTFFSFAQVIAVSTTSSGLVTVTSTIVLPATVCASAGAGVNIAARRLGRPVHKHKQPWQVKETGVSGSTARKAKKGLQRT